MIKALLVEWLKSYIIEEETPYSRYFTYIFIIIGLILLMAANYVYFYLGGKEVGNFIASSTIFFICAFIIESFACYFKQRAKYRTLARIKSGSIELSAFINKQISKLITIKSLTSALPLVIRFVPIGVVAFVVYRILKRKFLDKLASILLAASK